MVLAYLQVIANVQSEAGLTGLAQDIDEIPEFLILNICMSEISNREFRLYI